MQRLLLAVIVIFALTTTAFADSQLADNEYTDHAFGTIVVLHSPRQLVDPNQGWWGEKAAQEFNNPAYLVGLINSRRMDSGQPLLNPNDSLILLEAEESDEHGFRYPISFANMRPSEVKPIIEMLGGVQRVLPGTTSITYEPLQRRWIDVFSDNGQPLTIQIGATRIESPASVDFETVRQQVDGALQKMFNRPVPFDFTVSRSTLMDGSRTASISIYVDLNPRPANAETYEGEGGI